MQKYKEVIHAPFKVTLIHFFVFALALFVGLPIMVRLIIMDVGNMRLASWSEMFVNYFTNPPLLLLTPMWITLAIGFYLRNRIKIVIKNDHLFLKAQSRPRKQMISLEKIIDCNITPYECNFFPERKYSDSNSDVIEQKLTLPCYQGEGVVVSYYWTKASFSNLKSLIFDPKPDLEKILIKVHMPSNNAEQLCNLICTGKSSCGSSKS